MGRGCGRLHFYPRSPCGERLARCRCWVLSNAISIHALLAESDPEQLRTVRVSSSQDFYPRSPCGERLRSSSRRILDIRFLSTLSLRRATSLASSSLDFIHISIHALLAESDSAWLLRPAGRSDFYPRSPCGERHIDCCFVGHGVQFLSTLSLRRATVLNPLETLIILIFLSTLSLRRATASEVVTEPLILISIHALLAESDSW